MTLLDAMKAVLNNKNPMNVGEVADLINSNNLYKRSDCKPVPSSQICAYGRKYRGIFKFSYPYISLE